MLSLYSVVHSDFNEDRVQLLLQMKDGTSCFNVVGWILKQLWKKCNCNGIRRNSRTGHQKICQDTEDSNLEISY